MELSKIRSRKILGSLLVLILIAFSGCEVSLPGKGGTSLIKDLSEELEELNDSSPDDSDDSSDDGDFDFFLIAGQSNTHAGVQIDPTIDFNLDPNLLSLTRNTLELTENIFPLGHWTADPKLAGFGPGFGQCYRETVAPDRKVVLIGAGAAGTGFFSTEWDPGDWNPGDLYFEDAVFRANYLTENHNGRIKGILWHQGEKDTNVGNPTYESQLDTMIQAMRERIHGAADVPFLLGGMVPIWVQMDPDRQDFQDIIYETPERVPNTFAVSSDGLSHTTFGNPDPAGHDFIHFPMEAHREFALRYCDVYKEAMSGK